MYFFAAELLKAVLSPKTLSSQLQDSDSVFPVSPATLSESSSESSQGDAPQSAADSGKDDTDNFKVKIIQSVFIFLTQLTKVEW